MASWDDNSGRDRDPRGKATGVAVLISIILWLIAAILSGDAARDLQPSPTTTEGAAYTDALVESTTDFFAIRPATTECASTEAEWTQTVMDAGFTNHSDTNYIFGFSFPVRGDIYLAPRVCVGLRRGTAATYRRSNPGRVAWGVNVVLHEAMHVRLTTRDEAVTEACAAKYLPVALNRLYKIKYRTAEMRLLTSKALTMRRQMPAAYQGGRCPV